MSHAGEPGCDEPALREPALREPALREPALREPALREPALREPALRVVLCNAPPAEAERLARVVLDARLAACVNVVPGVVSLYWWKGEVCRDVESTLFIKTRADLVPALTDALRAAHPYEVPEIIALPLAEGEGNAAYRAWLLAETRGAGEPG